MKPQTQPRFQIFWTILNVFAPFWWQFFFLSERIARWWRRFDVMCTVHCALLSVCPRECSWRRRWRRELNINIRPISIWSFCLAYKNITLYIIIVRGGQNEERCIIGFCYVSVVSQYSLESVVYICLSLCRSPLLFMVSTSSSHSIAFGYDAVKHASSGVHRICGYMCVYVCVSCGININNK